MSPSSAPVDAVQTQRLLKLTEIIHFLHSRGWTPATSSNFSCRLPDEGSPGFSISVSGLDKGAFSAENFMDVDFAGQVIHPEQAHLRPSAETLLHALVYQKDTSAQVVLHTHSVNGTVLSKLYEAQKGIGLKDFEVLKGLEGTATHQTEIWLPIFSNAQDMSALSAEIEAGWGNHPPLYGFLLAGHGLYTWGATHAQAKRHVEVFEFLFDCILKLRSHGYPDYSR
ncbi:methylthioribulose 1-phosphate dehydratase [Vampirovibrio sp.]|uniref:methylthioribulose 1-phosphate dehydratase n=1 Tax=Vampirovibrio sp. TaxID=2717857 RepID=UPI003593E2F2